MTITVWSISYCQGRSERVHWSFFSTEIEAQRWLNNNHQRLRKTCGPLTHVMNGKKGVVSMLNTYSA